MKQAKNSAGLSREQKLELYYYMRLTRSLEERLVNLYRQTKVVGGVFRSLDGGKTFAKVLYKDADTGAIALAFDPRNAATHRRARVAR